MGNHNSHGNTHSHHIVPFKIYMMTAGALFILTFATVGFHQMHLGALAAPVAFLIASIKAALVLLYFMGLKYDNLMNRVIFGTSFFFLMLLFAICALDIWTRISEISTL